MKKIDPNLWNRLRNDGGHIAAEVAATVADCRRWIVIFKYKTPIVEFAPKFLDMPAHTYSILDFELKAKLIDEYFSEEDKHNQTRYYVQTENDLYGVLDEIGIDVTLFTYPWRCDCPL